jgi:hypothetical protein
MRVIRNDRQLPEDIANLTDELQTNLWLCCNKLCAAHASIPQEIMLLNYCYGHMNVTCVYERQMMPIKQSEFLNKTTNLTYSAFYHTLLLSTATCSELPHANTILNNPCDELAESGHISSTWNGSLCPKTHKILCLGLIREKCSRSHKYRSGIRIDRKAAGPRSTHNFILHVKTANVSAIHM